MRVTDGQRKVLDASSHLLVTGGPGSGKTTVSILKAAEIVEYQLRPEQKVLFLSFARATVARVLDAIDSEQQIDRDHKRRIDVQTYHSFFWRILKSHGYLIGLPRRLDILTPPAEGIALSAIRSGYPSPSKMNDEERQRKKASERFERTRLATQEGRICFDLFAPYVGDILCRSSRIRKLLGIMYPFIILDEFQDTNGEQWRVVRLLGEFSTLIALADPEQRIYDWIGADPQRLNHFRRSLSIAEVDLTGDNHRSGNTDIVLFGDDAMRGTFRQKSYKGIECCPYPPHGERPMTALVTTIYEARSRLVKNGSSDWSLAILVPTKKMTRLVSDALREPPAGLTKISHTAAIELEAAILAAEVIAFLMQPAGDADHLNAFVDLLINYFHGKGGDQPTQNDFIEATRIRKAYYDWKIRQAEGKSIRSNSMLINTLSVYESALSVVLTGNPDNDWQAVRRTMEEGPCSRLKGLAEEARNVRLLDRGAQLRQELSQDWRYFGDYRNALAITRQAFVIEHFSIATRPERGVVVMNMHKAKGKQFDEVIIFEGWPRVAKGRIVANTDRIVRGNDLGAIDEQTRQNFRVSITRGKQRTTILTPRNNPCVLLPVQLG